VVPGTEKLLPHIIPNSEGEVAKKALDAVRAPATISKQDQFGICPILRWREIVSAGCFQCCQELFARIDPRVSHDPRFAVQSQWLAITLGFTSSFQESVAETDVIVHPDSLRIRAAQFKGIRKLLEQATIERISVELHHTDNAAHTDE
jgi:hypothetical protein